MYDTFIQKKGVPGAMGIYYGFLTLKFSALWILSVGQKKLKVVVDYKRKSDNRNNEKGIYEEAESVFFAFCPYINR